MGPGKLDKEEIYKREKQISENEYLSFLMKKGEREIIASEAGGKGSWKEEER